MRKNIFIESQLNRCINLSHAKTTSFMFCPLTSFMSMHNILSIFARGVYLQLHSERGHILTA